LRALVGERYGEPRRPAAPPAATVTEACAEIGRMVAAEPWLDRVPATVRAAIAPVGRAFALADDGGSLPLLPGTDLDVLLAVSAGELVDVTVEWTPHGVLPLAVHQADRSIDIGPRADASFVAAS
jgi:hypothetical protein